MLRALFVFVLLLCALGASATETDPHEAELELLLQEGQLNQMMKELAPELEARTGRRFLSLPRVRIQGQNDAVESVLNDYKRLYPEVPAEELDAMGWALFEELRVLFGGYDPNLQLLLINSRNIRIASKGLAGASPRELVRCVLAHELVHALQDQHLGLLRETGLDPSRWWTEGQATYVETQLCEDPLSLLNISRGSPYDTQLPPKVQPYVQGTRLVSLVAEKHGMEGVWKAMAEQTLSAEEARGLVQASLMPGWTDPARLVPATYPLTRQGLSGQPKQLVILPQLILSVFAPQTQAPPLEPVMLACHKGVPVRQLALFAALAQDGADARPWVQAREAQVARIQRGLAEPLFLALDEYPMYRGTWRAMRRQEKLALAHADAASLFHVQVHTGHFYEAWLSRGPRLAIASFYTDSPLAGDVRSFIQSALTLLELPLDSSTPDLSAHPGWMKLGGGPGPQGPAASWAAQAKALTAAGLGAP